MTKSPSKGFAMLLEAAKAAGLDASPTGKSIVDRAERDELALVARDDPVMAAAMRKAREPLSAFLTLARKPRRGMQGFSVKVALRACDGAEYFWIHPFTREGDSFSGHLNSTPRFVHDVQRGDRITFTEHEIVDWMYMEAGKMHGNYTARAILKSASPEEREEFQRRFGLDYDF
jgi:uncharacterized protein YegJ (DUF2314 family)